MKTKNLTIPFRKTLTVACFFACFPAYAAESSAPTGQPGSTDTQELLKLIKAQDERIRMLEQRVADLAAPAPAPAQAPLATTADRPVVKPAPSAPDLKVTWGNGAPTFGKSDGSFTFKPRGRLLVDIDSTTNSALPGRNLSTTGLRGGRLGVEGTFFDNGIYQFEADFAEGKVGIVGAFVGYQGTSGAQDYDVRVGNIFNDRSLEGQTGSLTTPFIERNFVAAAILPQSGFYSMGAMTRVFGNTWHASLAVTGDAVDGSYAANDALTFSSRIHWNPVKTDATKVHLGLWGFHEALSDPASVFTKNTIIGARFNTALRVSTGPLPDAQRSVGLGAEVGAFHDNLYGWAEAGRRRLEFISGSPLQDFDADAWAVSAGWFLTGELAPYSAKQGNFTSPRIIRSVKAGGPGAIELVARHERLDYSDTPLGGEGDETSIGVNWYPVPLVRLMLNWSHWNVNNRVAPLLGEDSGDSIAARAQFNF